MSGIQHTSIVTSGIGLVNPENQNPKWPQHVWNNQYLTSWSLGCLNQKCVVLHGGLEQDENQSYHIRRLKVRFADGTVMQFADYDLGTIPQERSVLYADQSQQTIVAETLPNYTVNPKDPATQVLLVHYGRYQNTGSTTAPFVEAIYPQYQRLDDDDLKTAPSFQTLETHVNQVEQDLTNKETALQYQITSNDTDISNLSNRISSNDTEISNLSNRISSNDTEISNLSNRISSNDTDISSLSNRISSNDTDISNLSNRISSNDTDISNLSSQVESNDGDISTLSNRISSNDTDISNLNSRVLPVGSIILWTVASVPTGFLECNGAPLDPNNPKYSNLFAVIGHTYGNLGNSFRIPDLRGYFVRGWDHGRGVDPGRGLGSPQDDAFKSHNHSVSPFLWSEGYAGKEWVGSYRSLVHWGSGANKNVSLTGGTETRPKNIALMYIIKY